MTPTRLAQIKQQVAAGTHDLLPGTCPLGCVEFVAERLAQELEEMGTVIQNLLHVDDVVQIQPSDSECGGCFMRITEVSDRSVTGIIVVPGKERVSYVCDREFVKWIGHAFWC